MGIDFRTVPMELVINIFNIVVLYLLVRLLVYKPVKNFMQNRQDRIQKDLESAASNRKTSEDALHGLQDELDANRKKAALEAQEVTKSAALEAEKIISAARAEADKIITSARCEAEEEKKEMVRKSQDEIVSIACSMAEKLLGREVKPQDNDAIIQSFLKDGKVL